MSLTGDFMQPLDGVPVFFICGKKPGSTNRAGYHYSD